MTEQLYVRVTDLRAWGFSRLDAERLLRRASRQHGFYRLGRFNYVTRDAVLAEIEKARVTAT